MIFELIYQTFELKLQTKENLQGRKNNSQKTSVQIQNNFKSPEINYATENSQNEPTEGQNLGNKFWFVEDIRPET